MPGGSAHDRNLRCKLLSTDFGRMCMRKPKYTSKGVLSLAPRFSGVDACGSDLEPLLAVSGRAGSAVHVENL